MPVDSRHPDYTKHHTAWKKCRDATEGEEAIKAAGEAYLPRLTDSDEEEYKAYKLRAIFYGATGRTVKGLTGAVLRKPPQVDFSDEELLTSLGKGGESLDLLAQQVLEEVLSVGRVGVLVDAPEDDQGNPYVVLYYAENVLNWREEMLKGADGRARLQLTLVVLSEDVEVQDPEDPYAVTKEERYRVLQLVDGEYSVEVWRKTEHAAESNKPAWVEWEQVGETVYPAFRGGKRLDFIPFTFINPAGIGSECEKSPVLDLANVNLSHYRTSADLEHGRHFTGLPTLYLAGFDPSETKVRIGSSRAWTTENPNAKAAYVEFTGVGLGELRMALEEKQKQMAVLGARLLEEQAKAAQETATAVRLRQAGEKSILANVANTCSKALTMVLKWVGTWAAVASPDKASVALSEDYDITTIDGATLTALMASLQGGSYSFDSWFTYLEKCGMYPDGWTLKDERTAIEKGMPMSPAGDVVQQKAELGLEQQKVLLKAQKGGAGNPIPVPGSPAPTPPPPKPPAPNPVPPAAVK